jgi:hypothetical protein
MAYTPASRYASATSTHQSGAIRRRSQLLREPLLIEIKVTYRLSEINFPKPLKNRDETPLKYIHLQAL